MASSVKYVRFKRTSGNFAYVDPNRVVMLLDMDYAQNVARTEVCFSGVKGDSIVVQGTVDAVLSALGGETATTVSTGLKV